MKTLIPVLGDQLDAAVSALADADPQDSVILMMEVAEEARYVRHHKKKIAYIFSAMRHHAAALRDAGWHVDYVTLDDADNSGDFTGEVARAVSRHDPARIVVTEAGEWRVQAMLESWETLFGVPVEIRRDTRFLCSHAEFAAWAGGRTQLRLEYFYRDMRRRTGLLMDGDKPAGGKWNFDAENRKPAKRDLLMPHPIVFPPDEVTSAVIALVAARFPDHPGSLDGFDLAVTRDVALRQADRFFAEALPLFGDYEDAMLVGEHHLYHSILSPYLNSGLLDPLDLCRRAEAEYRAGRAPLNAVEGYIRQIIGWREYIRGIYWREGPDYADRNFLGATRALPRFYWTGETEMRCLAEVIGQTLATAHAHHIQRLMVTGLFALLIGADPKAVHLWYLEVYADAYEWVELPNTLGMSQFGDGGLLGSKPYAASGAYINRMSDYCGGCHYDPKQRIGPDACPFNALYWDFLARHEKKLSNNPRMAMPYRTWGRMAPADRDATRAQAAAFLTDLDASGPPLLELAAMDPLVTTEWLAANLAAPDLRIVDCSWFLPGDARDARGEFEEAHIPGAVFLDLADVADSASGLPMMLPPPEKFASRMARLGLGDGTHIVLYDNSPHHTAARGWAMLRSFGVPDIALLDGGVAKWRAEGRDLASGAAAPRPRHATPRDRGIGIRSLDQMRGIVAAGGAQIVDARSPARFAGEEPEPRPGVVPGHIPGSVNLHYARFFHGDGTWKQGDALRATFEGIDLDAPIVATCGSGVTACVIAFAAHLLGREAAVYDGSWAEWGGLPDTPKATGA